jgi:hypothetical protein
MGNVFAPLESSLAALHGLDEAGFFLEMPRKNIQRQLVGIAALRGGGVRDLRFQFPGDVHFHFVGSYSENTVLRFRAGAGSLLEGDVHFGIAARCGRVHHRGYAFQVQSHAGPFRRTGQDYEGNLPAREVLLVANPLIRSEQEINPRCLGRFQQSAIAQPVPTPCLRRDDGVAGKRTG